MWKYEIKVTRECIENTEVNEEMIFRQLAEKLIRDIPIENLNSIFFFEKLDPELIKLNSLNESDFLFFKKLKEQRTLIYKATLL
jgi:hypothetical protein